MHIFQQAFDTLLAKVNRLARKIIFLKKKHFKLFNFGRVGVQDNQKIGPLFIEPVILLLESFWWKIWGLQDHNYTIIWNLVIRCLDLKGSEPLSQRPQMLCKMIPISAFANQGFPPPNCERSTMSEDNYLSLSHNRLFVRSKTNFFQKQTFRCLRTNLHKVNRCLARYSPCAITTNQPKGHQMNRQGLHVPMKAYYPEKRPFS